MTNFSRSGHYRTNANGTTFWVRDHKVSREDWDSALLRVDLRRHDASSFLSRNSVRSISGCFVNPNARCPVCSAAVFFYANQSGSRVYFDDLGPPWAKHPCTDNPRQATGKRDAPSAALTPRPKGLMRELIAAANAAGVWRGKTAGVRSGRDWTLMVITAVERRGNKNTVKAEFLDSLSHETTEFACFSSEPIFEIGDLVSKSGNHFSFLHKETLSPVEFVADGDVPVPRKKEEPAESARLRAKKGVLIKSGSRLRENRAVRSKPEIEQSERKHFQYNGVPMEQFCATLAPVVKSLSRKGARKPRDVAVHLNRQGHKTASGGLWTPRLVYILLATIFGNKETTEQSGRSAVPPGNPPIASERPNSQKPLTSEEIAKRKAALKSSLRQKNP